MNLRFAISDCRFEGRQSCGFGNVIAVNWRRCAAAAEKSGNDFDDSVIIKRP
jgi:hypothetical protein